MHDQDASIPVHVLPYKAHDGESYDRPPRATAEHVPAWHRFVDALSGEIAEHISHWIIDPGPFGYLHQTQPIGAEGESLVAEYARCFNCGHPVTTWRGTMYRRDGAVTYIRCDDDPEYQENHRSESGNG